MRDSVLEKSPNPVLIIFQSVLLESFRRREFYAVLVLSLLFVLGIFIMTIVGIENTATANLLLNLGMTLAWFFAHIVTLFSAARQIPEDIENKTIFPLLAKPLKRSEYYIGKWSAVTLNGCATFVILFILGWAPAPKMQTYNSSLLLQTILLIMFSIALFAAFSMMMSLIFSNGVNVLISGLILVFWGHLHGFLNARFSLNQSWKFMRWILAYIPDFSKLNLITRYTDGMGSLTLGQSGAAILYALIFIMVALILGMAVFEKKSI